MPTSNYVSLSSQIALDNRMQSVARNVANINTAGYRGEAVSFSEILANAGSDSVSFVSMGQTHISREKGAISQSGNPLDLAIEGDAWFSFQRGGEVAYTRDGRMQMDSTGRLTTVNGEPILSASGSTIQVDPQGGSLVIQADGEIAQNGHTVDRIGLFEISPDDKLKRYGGSAVVPEGVAFPLQDPSKARVLQGFVEGSNVNPMTEMTRLIMISRAFESAQKVMETSEDAQRGAIRDLGETS
ncbi:flagellar basal-body rod protein FlgF [Cohaesibacter haloalkalitolerans]|uniref:flagellar basal-body rod protein FlgF n=1 Tax=Cohaesibacter haloalkalitolerans TaxID=1162980 RepID=UPI000E649DD9|nr:flagellar basal-body rod protein FlgF [Cohaesibacter haloalkalitolerans]